MATRHYSIDFSAGNTGELFTEKPKEKPKEKPPDSSGKDNNKHSGYGVEFYGTKDVARMIGCSVPTAREVMLRPDFPLIKVGRKLLVSRKALEEWASKRRV